MASTDMIVYLNYMSTWETETDENINSLIAEQNLFVSLDNFDSDTAVDREFQVAYDLACEVRDHTIAEDSLQIAADGAAIAAIWSFGIGMAAFAALQAAAVIESKVVSSKSKELNDKLTVIDTDIAANISPRVNEYVTKWKSNNNLINSKAPVGLDTRTCRSLLLQFMGTIQRDNNQLDAATFKKYSESARIIYNGSEINKVYDALDTLNLSGKTDGDVLKFMNVLKRLEYPKMYLDIVRNFAFALVYQRMNVARKVIETQAREAGIPVEEVGVSAFKAMDSFGKFAAGVAIAMSVVDVVFNVLDIVNVVDQCKKMCDELNTTIKQSYKSYFNGIKTSAQLYKAAIAPSAGIDGLYTTSVFYSGKWWDESHPVNIQGGTVTIAGVEVTDPQLGDDTLAFSHQLNSNRGAKPEAGALTFSNGTCTGWCQFAGEGPIDWRGTLVTA